MIEKLLKEFADYRWQEKQEDEYILELRTRAEGVGAIKYGDDTSRGSGDGDKMAAATIRLTEAKAKIAKKRVPRFELQADSCDWFYEHLTPEEARVMVMYAVDGLSYREISEKTGKSVGWVFNTVAAGMKKLSQNTL